MKFSELQQLLQEKFGIEYLADIARELGVSPQAVSNWKARDQVPYKYVIQIREKSINKNVNFHNKLKRENELPPFTDQQPDGRLRLIDDSHASYKEDTISIADVILILIKKVKLILFLPILIAFFVSLNTRMTYEPIYTATVKLLLQNTDEFSSFGNLTAQFGLTPSLKTDLTSISLIPELVESHTFAKNLFERKFYTEKYGEELSLLALLTYGLNKPTVGKDTLIIAASGHLQNMIRFESEGSFSLLIVETFEPKLAKEIANAVLEELEKLNRYFKSQQIISKREFIENRIKTVGFELEQLEEELKDFRKSNRNLNNSPTLLLKQERLSRKTEIHKGMFLTLKQQLELNKIEEIQAKSLIQVLDYPITPLEPSNKFTYYKPIILSLMFGLVFSIGLIFLIEYLSNSIKEEENKINIIKEELTINLINILGNRTIYILSTIMLIIFYPLLLNHRSLVPVYFGRYSTKAIIIIVIYMVICITTFILAINTNKIKIRLKRIFYSN